MKRFATLAALFLCVLSLAQEAPKRYEIKSGIAKSVTDMMGQKIEATAYFDNYGALETSKTKMSVPGVGEMEIATITKDGKTFVVNYSQKNVQETPAQESINYLALTDEVIGQYKIKEIGKETLGDKECTKYSQEVSQMGQKAAITTWVWKGFVLKSVTAVAGVEIVSEVVEFTPDAYILPQTFEVPTF